MHIFLSNDKGEEERNRKERNERWMGVNVVYTYTIKGRGCAAKALKGKRLRGSSEKLPQQEADYTTKGIHFAHRASTNSNKGARQHTGSWV